MKKNRYTWCVLITLLLFSGCYTQLSRQGPEQPARGNSLQEGQAFPDTFYFTLDTVYRSGDTLVDTIWYGDKEQIPDSIADIHAYHRVVSEPRNQKYCVWMQDFMGYPELRCFSSYSEFQIFLSSSAPWWIRDRIYAYSYYGCPPGYYYDPFSGYCRYYRDYGRFYRPWYRGHRPGRQYDRKTGESKRRNRSFTREGGQPPSGENAVNPGSGSQPQPTPKPERRGRSYQPDQPPSNPPQVAPPRYQESDDREQRNEDESSQPRKDPRRN